jgi:hypothetical protein
MKTFIDRKSKEWGTRRFVPAPTPLTTARIVAEMPPGYASTPDPASANPPKRLVAIDSSIDDHPIKPIVLLKWAVDLIQAPLEKVAATIWNGFPHLLFDAFCFSDDMRFLSDKGPSRLLAMRDRFREIFSTYIETGHWDFVSSERIKYSVGGRLSPKRKSAINYSSMDSDIRFSFQVLRILRCEGARLEKCAASKCRGAGIFVRGSRTKRYCTTQCEQGEATERGKGNQAERQRNSYNVAKRRAGIRKTIARIKMRPR